MGHKKWLQRVPRLASCSLFHVQHVACLADSILNLILQRLLCMDTDKKFKKKEKKCNTKISTTTKNLWKIPKKRNRNRQKFFTSMCVCVNMCLCVASLVNNGMKIPLLTSRWPQAQAAPVSVSVDDDDFLPWTSFRPQTKAGIFVTDCMHAACISLHILFVSTCLCVSVCVCVLCLALWPNNAFPLPFAIVCSFRAPFACFSTSIFHIHFPFPCQKCEKCKIKGGDPLLLAAVCYLWQCGKLPGTERQQKRVAQRRYAKKQERDHQRTTRWSTNAKLWKCIWKKFPKYFN